MPEGEDKWMVKWDSSMILPDLGETDSVKVDDIFGKRGEIYDRNDKPLAINTEDGNRDYPGGISIGLQTVCRMITMEELVDENIKDIVQRYNCFTGCEYQFGKIKTKNWIQDIYS